MTEKIKNTSTLKDVNMQKIKQESIIDRIDFLRFRKQDIEKINKMIEVDTQLMCDFKLMDYSLLFAIEKIPRNFRKRFSTKVSAKTNNIDFTLETSSMG